MRDGAFMVPAGPQRVETAVLNSRFIASLDYVPTVEEARAFVARARAEFPDASHNVPAFIVGGGNSRTEYCSDDGEPSGTSGRPLLAVLRGSGFGDVAVVVTRYFGGTLLGTGGLVKAYSEAGRLVLEKTRRAELVETRRLRLDLPYRLIEPFRRMAAECGAIVVGEEFGEVVAVRLDVAAQDLPGFEARLAGLSSGSVVPEALGTRLERRAC